MVNLEKPKDFRSKFHELEVKNTLCFVLIVYG